VIWLTTALSDGVDFTTHHPGSRGVACIMSVTMPLLSIEDFAVAIRYFPPEWRILYLHGLKAVVFLGPVVKLGK